MTARITPDPAAGVPRPGRAARATVPGGPDSSVPPAESGGKTSRQVQAPKLPAPDGTPGPETRARPSGRGQAPVRARVQTPAGGEPASPREATSLLPAGSTALSGAEWRAAAKAAQSKTRRREPARSAAAKPALLPPVTGGAALTATATCIGHCDWTAGPGNPAEVDKAAENHTTKPPKHPTSLVSKVAAATERPGAA